MNAQDRHGLEPLQSNVLAFDLLFCCILRNIILVLLVAQESELTTLVSSKTGRHGEKAWVEEAPHITEARKQVSEKLGGGE